MPCSLGRGLVFNIESGHSGRNAGYTWAPMNALRCFPFRFSTNPRLWLAVILAVLTNTSAVMAGDHFDNPNRPDDLTPAELAEPEQAEELWKEQQEPLPIFPRAQDLIPVRADAGAEGYNYFIDVNSVSLAADEVLRYTIVIQSPDGASNIIYEGSVAPPRRSRPSPTAPRAGASHVWSIPSGYMSSPRTRAPWDTARPWWNATFATRMVGR